MLIYRMPASEQSGSHNPVLSKLDLFNTNLFSQLHCDHVIIAAWIVFTCNAIWGEKGVTLARPDSILRAAAFGQKKNKKQQTNNASHAVLLFMIKSQDHGVPPTALTRAVHLKCKHNKKKKRESCLSCYTQNLKGNQCRKTH